MTQHDPTVRMRHMLDHAKEAVGLLVGKEKTDLSITKENNPTLPWRPLAPSKCLKRESVPNLPLKTSLKPVRTPPMGIINNQDDPLFRRPPISRLSVQRRESHSFIPVPYFLHCSAERDGL